MIIGIGTDLVDSKRIERTLATFGDKFLTRILTPYEQQRVQSRAHVASGCAKIFAAKEAMLKALGTGLANRMSWQHMEVRRDGNTPPTLHLSGEALQRCAEIIPPHMIPKIHLSLSDEWPYVSAFVILSAAESSGSRV